MMDEACERNIRGEDEDNESKGDRQRMILEVKICFFHLRINIFIHSKFIQNIWAFIQTINNFIRIARLLLC